MLNERFRILHLGFLLLLGICSTPLYGATDLDSGVKELATTLAQAMTGDEVLRLAVIDFSDIRGYSSALEVYLAEELTTQFFQVAPGKFNIVERRHLVRVLNEQELTASALFDEEAIAKVGKILGIDAIVTGSIAETGEVVKINARTISVETALLFAAASTTVPKEGIANELLIQGSAPGDSVIQRSAAEWAAGPGFRCLFSEPGYSSDC